MYVLALSYIPRYILNYGHAKNMIWPLSRDISTNNQVNV